MSFYLFLKYGSLPAAGLDDDGMVPSDDKPGKRSNDFVGLVNLSPYFKSVFCPLLFPCHSPQLSFPV